MVEQDLSKTIRELLALVQSLVKEVPPNLPASQIISLDSTFDKDLGLDSLVRIELLTTEGTKAGIRSAGI